MYLEFLLQQNNTHKIVFFKTKIWKERMELIGMMWDGGKEFYFFHIRALRNIYTYVLNQQTHADKVRKFY
jgi:hypothetical protein